MKKIIVVIALLFPSMLSAAVKTETILYDHGSATLEGFLAYDDAVQGKRPGVLVYHEWWGINSYIENRCKQLAEMGYVVFAPDIYGKGKRTNDSKVAGEWSTLYKKERGLMRSRAHAGYKVLKGLKQVKVDKIAAIGYCFGGTTALELARGGVDLAGVVSFHGGLDTPTPEDAKKIKGKVLVLHGADDPHVPMDQVVAFQDEMRKAKVDWQMTSYSGAVHTFTNPAAGHDNSKGSAYNEAADRRSWIAMKNFFDEIFPQ